MKSCTHLLNVPSIDRNTMVDLLQQAIIPHSVHQMQSTVAQITAQWFTLSTAVDHMVLVMVRPVEQSMNVFELSKESFEGSGWIILGKSNSGWTTIDVSPSTHYEITDPTMGFEKWFYLVIGPIAHRTSLIPWIVVFGPIYIIRAWVGKLYKQTKTFGVHLTFKST